MRHATKTNFSAQVVHGEYYPHIDGIRALAVLPVMLFHVLAGLCPGGFVGVDVFFVISGYLITGGILRDLKNDRFTVRNFYHRRIRRIMPAYFALIAGVFVAGCALYYATPLIGLGDSVVAGTLFLANFHFAEMAGNYFAPSLHTQALLHLWSLSVEEQFYLFIPLLCATLWKVSRRLLVPALALLAVLSLSGSIYAVMMGKQNDAFYLLHFRAWELLSGSLLAMLPAIFDNAGDAAPVGPMKRYALLAAIGLATILASYAVISSTTPFPGLAALPPVVGTALLIRYGQFGWVFRLLACRPFVAIGKMSYSLYLWHWPVVVFWRYAAYDHLGYYDYLGMFVLSLVLGYLSWRFVETPVRTSSAWTPRRSFLFAAAGITFLVALGTACVSYRAWPTILHPDANEVAYIPPPRDPFLKARIVGILRRVGSVIGHEFEIVIEHDVGLNRTPFTEGSDGSSSIGGFGPPEVFLLGDSHAGSLRYGLDGLLLGSKIAGYAVSCSNTNMFDLSLPATQAALKKLSELPRVSHVLLVEMWAREHFHRQGGHLDSETKFARLEEFALQVKSMKKTLLIATDIPCYPCAPADIAARLRIIAPRQTNIASDSERQSAVEYDRVQRDINLKLEEICKRTGAVLIPLHLAFKQQDHYVPFETHGGETVALYRNDDHLTMAGSLRAARFIMPYLFPRKSETDQLLGTVNRGLSN